jgi:2,3-bisphosphoglycerate-independent phosphoglycerate mutase
MKPKFAVLVGDGMADYPIAELNNKTPLEYAQTPNMDTLAQGGYVGAVATIPDKLPPGSDVANLSLMGYDAKRFYSGRAPFEAASLGIKLNENETAFRCNLVTIENQIMKDYSAGHIETKDSHLIIKELQSVINSDSIRLYPGISYRHILVIKDFPSGIKCTPPHDITDQNISAFIPNGKGSEILNDITLRAKSVLEKSEINSQLKAAGKRTVSDVWLWGYGRAVTLPTLERLYGLQGSVISAVDLVRGLGYLAGLTIRLVDGATGYLGTNYAGKVEAARKALVNEDFVYLHVEAPDETSHEGNLHKKIQAIEEFDKNIVGEMLLLRNEFPNLKILVAPDHATPISLKTHASIPVPFIINGPGISSTGCSEYSEKMITSKDAISGPELFSRFIKGSF